MHTTYNPTTSAAPASSFEGSITCRAPRGWTTSRAAGSRGLVQTLGGKVGMKVEQFANAKLILIWGSNSIGSNLHFWRYAQEAKRQGARLVCIDPRKTETADKCHEHIAIRPGTDAALAFALMHELIVNDWLDHEYIAQHTLGWDALRERAAQWPPERAAEICGVPVEQIRSLARDYGTIKPAAIRLNYGMQRVRGGGNAVRAIACLPALVGAWRQRAGGLLLSASGSFPVRRAALYERLGEAGAQVWMTGTELAPFEPLGADAAVWRVADGAVERLS